MIPEDVCKPVCICIPEDVEPKVLYIQYLKMNIFKIILFLKINTPLYALSSDDPEVYIYEDG